MPELDDDARALSESLLENLNYDSDPAGGSGNEIGFLDDLNFNVGNSPRARLERLLDHNEEHAATVMKQWLNQKEAA
ncbi:hypothetical protein [Aurantimonas coralicida]